GTDKNPRATEVNFSTDQDFGGSNGFQTGSTFKAFVLASWLEAGKSLNDVVDAPPRKTFPRSVWRYDGCTSWADDAQIKNVEPSAGRMSVLEATRRSSNTGYVTMASQLNMCDIGKMAASMGIQRADGPTDDGEPLQYNVTFV